MIRRRLMLVAAPLCAVMVAASVAFASTTGTEHSIDSKLDDPHVVRPIAASSSDLDPGLTPQRLRAMLHHQTDQAALQATVAAEWQAAADRQVAATLGATLGRHASTTVPQTGSGRVTGAAGSASPAAPIGGTSADVLACIRAHESDTAGGYQAVSSGGTYRGAYQFAQSTWDNAASAAGRADLVGVDPASSSPADQDAVASYLYSVAGSQPWGGRC